MALAVKCMAMRNQPERDIWSLFDENGISGIRSPFGIGSKPLICLGLTTFECHRSKSFEWHLELFIGLSKPHYVFTLCLPSETEARSGHKAR